MAGGRVTVRRFRADDQRAARALIETGLGEHFGFIDPDANPDLLDIGAVYCEPHAAFFVAELDGRIVGTTGVLIERDAVRMVRLAVAGQHRRARIASALLNEVIELASAARAREVIAYTQPEWRDAMEFYASHGFVQHGRDDVDVHLRRPISDI